MKKDAFDAFVDRVHRDLVKNWKQCKSNYVGKNGVGGVEAFLSDYTNDCTAANWPDSDEEKASIIAARPHLISTLVHDDEISLFTSALAEDNGATIDTVLNFVLEREINAAIMKIYGMVDDRGEAFYL